jgi:hypothetical protein
LKEYPKCPYVVMCSLVAHEGRQFSWTCLRLRRTVGRTHCEQCERTIVRMINVQCR